MNGTGVGARKQSQSKILRRNLARLEALDAERPRGSMPGMAAALPAYRLFFNSRTSAAIASVKRITLLSLCSSAHRRYISQCSPGATFRILRRLARSCPTPAHAPVTNVEHGLRTVAVSCTARPCANFRRSGISSTRPNCSLAVSGTSDLLPVQKSMAMGMRIMSRRWRVARAGRPVDRSGPLCRRSAKAAPATSGPVLPAAHHYC